MRGASWTDADKFTLRDTAIRFEDWELPYALVMGSRAAVEYALEIGLDAIRERNRILVRDLREQLNGIGWKTHDRGKEISAIISTDSAGANPSTLVKTLRGLNINTTLAQRQNAVIDFDSKGVNWILRISPHYFNTKEEIEVLIRALEGIEK